MKPLLFVHIPKTAGLSIMACGVPARRVKHYPIVHPLSEKILTQFLNVAVKEPMWKRDYESFTVVRDPCTRFVSAYTYLLRGGNQKPLDLGYQALLLTYADVDAVLDDLNHLKRRIVHFVDQSAFVVDSQNDEILVDHILRFENLLEELVALDPRFVRMREVHRNQSGGSDRAPVVLTQAQRQRLASVYERDYRVFGYQHEFPQESSPMPELNQPPKNRQCECTAAPLALLS